jgi:guanylate kinase
MLGMLIIISGPSGTGKGTIVKRLLENPDFELSVSRTTRPPRPGEIDGTHYHFTEKAEFERLIAQNAFFEYAAYNDNFYGTPIENVERRLRLGKNVILEIDVQGALKIMDFYKKPYFSVFLAPPSAAELKKRLSLRGDSPEEIERRAAIAVEELKAVPRYDYIVVNEDLDKAVADLESITRAEALRTCRGPGIESKLLT